MEYQQSSTNLTLTWQLKCLLEDAWLSEAFPEEWTFGIIVKIKKKGNLKIFDNWRGTCVLPAISKISFKVILDRIKYHLYSTIDREQAGFRPESSCVDHINTLRISIEQSAKYRSDLHLVFVDFENVFENVDRDGHSMALRQCGCVARISI